ncbi:MAG: S-layer homology domain-containing protein [Clostridia bacterium]|nr:S-layer homology domain-containing protein [Clostridia bacterium]
MKKISALLLALLLVISIPFEISAAQSVTTISPALNIISARLRLAKSGNLGETISFSASDFDECLNSRVSSITISSLPEIIDGRLYLNSIPVKAGQTISRKELASLTFMPIGRDENEASFKFKAGNFSSGSDITCMIYNIEGDNFAPSSLVFDDELFTVSCYQGIDYYGVMRAVDPEGDSVTFEISTPPARGSLKIINKQDGSFIYTPLSGYKGTDKFEFTAVDKYGNRSNPVSMSIEILQNDSKVVYSDLDGHWAYNAAIAVSNADIMHGKTKTTFSPDALVSRAEFLTNVMKAAGYTVKGSIATTFFDDTEIPVEYRGYVAAGVELGFVFGTEQDGVKVFNANEPITRSEAAVIVNRILNLPTPTVKAVFSDISSVPTWAVESISALVDAGILNGNGSTLMAHSNVTRAQTAQIVYKILQRG